MPGKKKLLKLVLAAGLAGLAATSAGEMEKREVIIISANAASMPGNGNSMHPSISADGRFVAFRSNASDLVPGDNNGFEDIFVKNAGTGAINRASITADGVEGDADSTTSSISSDGRWVVFVSSASNLAPGTSGTVFNVLAKDMETGGLRLASASEAGLEGNLDSYDPVISADGRFVAFSSDATNLVPGDTNGQLDIFVKDMQSGYIQRVTVSSSGEQANDQSGHIYGPSISADGTRVAFSSGATNLSPDDTDSAIDVFVKDLQSGEVRLASASSEGIKGNGNNLAPTISADGTKVAFRSMATNLAPADAEPGPDIYHKDLESGDLTLASSDVAGAKADQPGWDPFISPDGGSVAFSSLASNLTPGVATVVNYNVFLKNIGDGSVKLVSATSAGMPGNDTSVHPALSHDARYIAFESLASNLASGDQKGSYDIFLTLYEPAEPSAGC